MHAASYYLNPIDVAKRTLKQVVLKEQVEIDISEKAIEKITTYYDSFEDHGLLKPDFKYAETQQLDALTFATIYTFEHVVMTNGNYQIGFIYKFDIYNEEAKRDGHGYILEDVYDGMIVFELKKEGLVTWSVENITISEISLYTNPHLENEDKE